MPTRVIAVPETRNATSDDESGADAMSDASISKFRVVGSVGGRNQFASSSGSSASRLPRFSQYFLTRVQ